MINSLLEKIDSTRIIRDVLFHRFSDRYLEIFAKDSLYCLINDEDYFILKDEYKPELIEIF